MGDASMYALMSLSGDSGLSCDLRMRAETGDPMGIGVPVDSVELPPPSRVISARPLTSSTASSAVSSDSSALAVASAFTAMVAEAFGVWARRALALASMRASSWSRSDSSPDSGSDSPESSSESESDSESHLPILAWPSEALGLSGHSLFQWPLLAPEASPFPQCLHSMPGPGAQAGRGGRSPAPAFLPLRPALRASFFAFFSASVSVVFVGSGRAASALPALRAASRSSRAFLASCLVATEMNWSRVRFSTRLSTSSFMTATSSLSLNVGPNSARICS